jgi:hypothetical protein
LPTFLPDGRDRGTRRLTAKFWIGISGILRVTASRGETREIAPGTPWLMEDTTGKGHATTAVGDETAIGAIIQLLPKEGR